MEAYPEISTNLGQVAALRGFAERVGVGHVAIIDSFIEAWPASLRESAIRASHDPKGFWLNGSWDDVWKEIENSFIDRPFGDLGLSRTVSWSALGIRWSGVFNNTYNVVPLAEEFIAELQIAIAALAGNDLCLLPPK